MERGLEAGMERGIAEGREFGERRRSIAVLTRLLAKRDGSVAPEVVARMDAATATELDAWVQRVIDGEDVPELSCA